MLNHALKAAFVLGLGLDDDGMCSEHGGFGCKRCVAELKDFVLEYSGAQSMAEVDAFFEEIAE
jgi:hypothetical protein